MRSVVWLALVAACHHAPSASPEERARAAIEQLEHDNPAPLAELITPSTTWDGATAAGGIAVGTTTTRDIAAAGVAAKALVGDFRRIAFVWTEGDWIYLVSEHAGGDFVYMVRFDADQQLAHLTFTTPDRLPSPSGCGAHATALREDGTVFHGPRQDTPPSVVIVGSLGGGAKGPLAEDLAGALACAGIASIVGPVGMHLGNLPASVRFLVAHRDDNPLLTNQLDVILVNNPRPTLARDSGRNVLAASHLKPEIAHDIIAHIRATP